MAQAHQLDNAGARGYLHGAEASQDCGGLSEANHPHTAASAWFTAHS